MTGLIQLTRKILALADKEVSERVIVEQDLNSQIFKEFLFASYFSVLSSDGIAVKLDQKGRRGKKKTKSKKSNKSREEAFSLLNQLVSGSSFLMNRFLEQNLLPMLMTLKKPNTWIYAPPGSSTEDSAQQYVGLRNLGCICYMNSMMQ